MNANMWDTLKKTLKLSSLTQGSKEEAAMALLHELTPDMISQPEFLIGTVMLVGEKDGRSVKFEPSFGEDEWSDMIWKIKAISLGIAVEAQRIFYIATAFDIPDDSFADVEAGKKKGSDFPKSIFINVVDLDGSAFTLIKRIEVGANEVTDNPAMTPEKLADVQNPATHLQLLVRVLSEFVMMKRQNLKKLTVLSDEQEHRTLH